jgi:hypothetical protein
MINIQKNMFKESENIGKTFSIADVKNKECRHECTIAPEDDAVVVFIKGYLLMISKAIRMNSSLVGYLLNENIEDAIWQI